MSKMDGLRAMREARYEAARAAAGKTAAPRKKAEPPVAPATKAKAKAPAKKATSAPVAPEATEELCGHKAISGRTCTREKGHAAKSHRYA